MLEPHRCANGASMFHGRNTRVAGVCNAEEPSRGDMQPMTESRTAHERGRLPTTEQVSRFVTKHTESAIRERTTLPPEIQDDKPAGAAARAAIGKAAYDPHVKQFACAGL